MEGASELGLMQEARATRDLGSFENCEASLRHPDKPVKSATLTCPLSWCYDDTRCFMLSKPLF